MKILKPLFAIIITLMWMRPLYAEKNSVVIGMQLEPPNLDPTGGAAAAIDEVVYSNVYEGLTRFRADGSVTPGLAKSWTISDNGLVYTFQLQEDVKFHNGSDFDASDVKFSIDRARDENSTNAQKGLFKGIRSVDVVNSYPINVVKCPGSLCSLADLATSDHADL